MIWNTEIEVILEKRLKEKFRHSPADASKYFGYYTTAKSILIEENIFDDIKIIQKGLSDHGGNHIKNVLSNVYYILGNELLEEIDAIQLYFICLLVLFHDVGNMTVDRQKHHEKDVILEVYDYIRSRKTQFNEERILVPEVASKHSGTASDGSKDTINELSFEPPYLYGTKIHSKKCAALLRFADELAEGPHRTSIFMNKYYNYPYNKKSVIYHRYAEITNVNIDRNGERVCLTYTFTLDAQDGIISEKVHKDFVELFAFTIRRLLKLEAERKYCKYYCDWLNPFKKTDVTFNFYVDDISNGRLKTRMIDSKVFSLVLNDLTLPTPLELKKFFKENSLFSPENVYNSIKEKFNEK